jgi:hypothetical protein
VRAAAIVGGPKATASIRLRIATKQ